MASITEEVKSTREMVSYGLGKFQIEFFTVAFGVVVFKYYETEVQLAPMLTALGLIIYSIWNAVNDPLIGFLTEKQTTPLTKKYGRRFPWILGGLFSWGFSFILIFLIPDPVLANEFFLFLWMVFSLCLFDTLYSLWDVNYQSIFPDKFRSEYIRSRATGIATGIGVFGIAIGFVLPSALVVFGEPSTYVTTSIVIAIVGFFLSFLTIPGVRETPEMITRYVEDRQERQSESFFKELKNAFRQRNFVAWIILYFFYQAAVVSMTGSVQYIGDYILPGGSSDTTIIFVSLLVGALLGLIIWLQVFKRIESNQNILMMTALWMAFFALPLTLPTAENYLSISILIFFFGLGFGGYWMIMTPALADVIDEIVIKSGKRNDGIFMGFRAFFGRLAYTIQALSFWIVHQLTEFDPKLTVDSMPRIAKNGIHIHMALIPAILLFVGVIVFWRINTLSPSGVKQNKEKLKELNL